MTPSPLIDNGLLRHMWWKNLVLIVNNCRYDWLISWSGAVLELSAVRKLVSASMHQIHPLFVICNCGLMRVSGFLDWHLCYNVIAPQPVNHAFVFVCYGQDRCLLITVRLSKSYVLRTIYCGFFFRPQCTQVCFNSWAAGHRYRNVAGCVLL